MRTSTILATTVLAVSTAWSWNISKRCEDNGDLCFLSFIWCDYKGHCSLPPEVYPQEITSNTEYPMILADRNYTIKWESKDNSHGPIRLQWQMDKVNWETNVTGTEFIFNAAKILNSFPTEQHPNISAGDAWYAASQWPANIISITYANLNTNFNAPFDTTQQFIVQPSIVKDYIETQVKIQYNRWKLGVGLGVGLGVPFLVGLTALVTWLVCKRMMKKPQRRPMEMALQ
ncbi:hypothetical protein F5Y01DRAFT_256576 [Xylaria sp. FL0043]|nr:hypothetical protein F5Y01DRAFT_256576 [Xylaria sp. FL0043]